MNPTLAALISSLCGISAGVLLLLIIVSVNYRRSQHQWLYERGFEAGVYFYRQGRQRGMSIQTFSQKPTPKDPYDRGRADGIRQCIAQEKP